MKTIDVLFDMETRDPDDVLTLCLLGSHPRVKLRAVTVMPGTNEQVGLVRHVLERLDLAKIPIGSCKIGYEKDCVSGFYYKWFPKFKPATPDGEGFEIIAATLRAFPETIIITGAALKNFKHLDQSIPIKKWVGQGGFAGDNVVPEEFRLEKFKGRLTCATYNFNGDWKTAFQLLENPNIHTRHLVSKNVCHGVVYNQEWHERMASHRQQSAGLEMLYQGMSVYLNVCPEGKKFHDPLAACTAIDPSIITFKEVELFRSKGQWGANLKEGTNTFISIAADQERFFEIMVE